MIKLINLLKISSVFYSVFVLSSAYAAIEHSSCNVLVDEAVHIEGYYIRPDFYHTPELTGLGDYGFIQKAYEDYGYNASRGYAFEAKETELISKIYLDCKSVKHFWSGSLIGLSCKLSISISTNPEMPNQYTGSAENSEKLYKNETEALRELFPIALSEIPVCKKINDAN